RDPGHPQPLHDLRQLPPHPVHRKKRLSPGARLDGGRARVAAPRGAFRPRRRPGARAGGCGVSRLARLLAWAGVALLAALLGWRSLGGDETLRYYAPETYVARADAFIQSGALKAECSGDRVQLVEHLQQASAAERSWYPNSYLAEDVERFNGDPEGFGWAFDIDQDCRLRAVNPAFHRIALPFANPILWLGSLYYRGGPTQAKLRSADREITLRHPDAPVRAEDQGTTRVGAAEDLTGEEAVLLHFAGGEDQAAARLFPVGRETVVENRARSGEPETVRLLWHALPRGRRARLATGDW